MLEFFRYGHPHKGKLFYSPECPLIEGHVFPVDQENRAQYSFNETGPAYVTRDKITAPEHAGKVVLPGLRGSHYPGCDFLKAQVLGIKGQQLFPDGTERSKIILKDFTVGGNSQVLFRNPAPFHEIFRSTGNVQETLIE